MSVKKSRSCIANIKTNFSCLSVERPVGFGLFFLLFFFYKMDPVVLEQ